MNTKKIFLWIIGFFLLSVIVLIGYREAMVFRQAEYTNTTVEEVLKMQENQESFVLVIVTEECIDCDQHNKNVLAGMHNANEPIFKIETVNLDEKELAKLEDILDREVTDVLTTFFVSGQRIFVNEGAIQTRGQFDNYFKAYRTRVKAVQDQAEKDQAEKDQAE